MVANLRDGEYGHAAERPATVFLEGAELNQGKERANSEAGQRKENAQADRVERLKGGGRDEEQARQENRGDKNKAQAPLHVGFPVLLTIYDKDRAFGSVGQCQCQMRASFMSPTASSLLAR